jgi:hypothetical protein
VSEPFGIEEHRHRFCAWAAARAAQRQFTSVRNLCRALETCSVREFLASAEAETIDEAGFEARHRQWCHSVMRSLNEAGVQNVTYGRAAKLLAVYLKGMVVLGPVNGTLGSVAHPPVDLILLRNLCRDADVESPWKAAWTKVKWTKLNEGAYYELIGQLREALPSAAPFWQIERYWTVTDGT